MPLETGLVYMVIGITNIPMRMFLGWLADQEILSAVISTIYSFLLIFVKIKLFEKIKLFLFGLKF